VVPWDSKNQFFAFFRFLATTLHSDATPFWNPFHYAGHPSLADPQSLILSPPFLIWSLFDQTPSLRAFDMLVFAHLLFGGIVVVLYGRFHGWPAAACVLAPAPSMSPSSRSIHCFRRRCCCSRLHSIADRGSPRWAARRPRR
jgi:hypothetical protein